MKVAIGCTINEVKDYAWYELTCNMHNSTMEDNQGTTDNLVEAFTRLCDNLCERGLLREKDLYTVLTGEDYSTADKMEFQED